MPEETLSMPAPSPIPAPPDFPVRWEDPGDAQLPWMQDRQHAPQPITPMTAAFAKIFGRGMSKALAGYDQPMAAHLTRINTYYYMSIAPTLPPDQMHTVEAQAIAGVERALGSFSERWEQEWLPEVQQHLDFWRAFDLQAATPAALAAHLEESCDRYERLWEIHFLVAFPFLIAPSMFEDMYADLFPGRGKLNAYTLLRGLHSKSLEADRALWLLAEEARKSAPIRSIIEAGATPTETVTRLRASDEAQPFLVLLDRFLDEFGRRSDTVLEVADPSWTEDPSAVIANVRAYLLRPVPDPAIAHADLSARRERAVEDARSEIANYPQPVRDQFEFFLRVGQDGCRLQEDHNYWIDQQSLHYLRQVLLEAGRRLVSLDVLDEPSDVFYLEADAVVEALRAAEPDDRKAAVQTEKEMMARWQGIAAPPAIGTDYGPPPDNAVTRAIGRMFGLPTAAPEGTAEQQASIIHGNAGSSGKTRGTARIIMTIADAHRLQPGEILVAPTTAPPWTPLFATASAVVTETGGVLSHCAVVAREYEIPAVVNARGATSLIRDGQTIEVDGDAGEVRLV